jgi:HK97 family phage major capsid protein
MNIYEQRSALIAQAEALIDAAESADRDLSAEESARYTELTEQIAALGGRIDRQRQIGQWRAAMAQSQGRATIGLTDDETRSYSILRALRALASGNWKGAEFEREASQAVAQRLGREPRGLFLPFDIQTRDLLVGTGSAGGYLKGQDPINFVELLRNRPLVAQAGARVLTGLVGDVPISRLSAGSAAYWIAETGETVTESTHTYAQAVLQPSTIAARLQMSHKFLRQSSVDAERLAVDDLSAAVAVEIDRASLHGSGSGAEPAGIAATAGIGSVAGGDNGAAPTWTHIVNLEREVAIDNADVGRLAYMTNPKVRAKLKGTEKASGNGWVWSEDNRLNGYSALVTNQVSSTLDKGTAEDVCSAIFFGNWADLLIGYWGILDVIVDPYVNATAGLYNFHVMAEADIQVRNPASFAAMLDALTT